MNLDKAKELADAHWGYVREVILVSNPHADTDVAEFHYKAAFVHGFKHAYEEMVAEEPPSLSYQHWPPYAWDGRTLA